MTRKMLPSVSLLMTLTMISPICALAANSSQNEMKTNSVHGLENIGLDSWTELLQKGQAQGKPLAEIQPLLQMLINSVKNEQQLFKQGRDLLRSAHLQSSDDYRDLALLIFEMRQELRQRFDMTLKSRQDSLFLLQLMAEESLYIGSKKFADFPKEISFSDKVVATDKTSLLREFSVQTGDVVLSKSTGFGSSSFIALSMDHPHIYSHSTPIYVDDHNQILSPEAEIEDGVKLRNMTKDYVHGSKTRMFIYRYQGNEPDVQNKVVAGMNHLVAEMYQRTGGDPFNKAAFLYDFSMQPGNADQRGLFCSSVAYEAYVRAGLENSANPYEKSLWSPVNKGREILLKALNMNSDRVPAPGDLELNKNFRLVGARIDVTKIHQDRIEMAIIDSFLAELDANRTEMSRLAQALESVASKPVDKKALMALATSGLLPKEVSDKAGLIEKIPNSINLKQMVFFSFLNDVMTPKIRAALQAQVVALEKQGRIVGPMELRKIAKIQGESLKAEIATLEQKLTAALGVNLCNKVL